MRKKTHEEYVAELEIKNPDVKVIGQYAGSEVKIMHQCLKHDIYWETKPNNVLQGKGCKECQKEKSKEKRVKSHEQYVLDVFVKNPIIEVIDKYIDKNTPILHRCTIHDVYWYASPTNILAGKGCRQCMREKIGNALVKSHSTYVSELKIKNPSIEVVEEYINISTPITHHCLIHDIYWKIAPHNALNGQRCIECKKENLRQSFVKSHSQYVDEVALINPDIEVVGKYMNAKTPILHRCKIDGCEWMCIPNNVLYRQCSCPQCNESSGERQIRQWLEKHSIYYIYQKSFVDCCDIKSLPFDFYLPEYNICVEYDGIHHFEPIDFAGEGKEWAENQFEYIQKHDKIKTEYCKNNNIKLLRIPYYKNVEEELNNFLFI